MGKKANGQERTVTCRMARMGVFKRKDSPFWWYRVQIDGQRVTGSTGTPDKRLATKIALEKRHQLIEGKFFPSLMGKHTRLSQMVKTYIEKHSLVNKRSSADDVRMTKKFIKSFGDISLAAITPEKIESYKASRRGQVKEATINRELACLKSMFSKAVLWGYAADNPVKKVRLYREALKPVRILTSDEKRRLFSGCPLNLRPIILLALKTGMRRGEIINLKWADVDLNYQNIHIRRTKSGKLRVIPIHPELSEILTELRMDKRSDYVFSGSKGEQLKGCGMIRTSFDIAVGKAGLNGLTFHDLRHNFATELVSKGADLRTVQEYLGHSTLLMVQRYAHVTEGVRRSTIQLLGRENLPTNTTLTLRSDIGRVAETRKTLVK